MTTEERLEKLERELARGQRFNRWLLAGLVLWIGAWFVVWALSREQQGRYALSAGRTKAYVLDTRTGQLWQRGSGTYANTHYYLGTNENPECEYMEAKEPKSPGP